LAKIVRLLDHIVGRIDSVFKPSDPSLYRRGNGHMVILVKLVLPNGGEWMENKQEYGGQQQRHPQGKAYGSFESDSATSGSQ
jgi:hypothetical protein